MAAALRGARAAGRARTRRHPPLTHEIEWSGRASSARPRHRPHHAGESHRDPRYEEPLEGPALTRDDVYFFGVSRGCCLMECAPVPPVPVVVSVFGAGA